ncbi:MAG: VOC family protein [Myxococcales bacterium]|nr:VOC family protein [Myxococcales bacterium]MCB9714741.1 VOC family protein [Myxococcales bacterium]
MNANKLFPLIVTDKLAETKAYYTAKAGFTVTVDMDGYLQVRHGGEDGPELCFMRPCSESPIGPTRPFDGQGLIVSIPTPDADAKHDQLRARGADIVAEPSDKPWGWRSFMAEDPNGVRLDFFHVQAQSAVADATG